MTDPIRELPAIFIASHQAEQLRDLLIEALNPGISIGLADKKAEVVANYGDEPVVLGSPDLVAELMKTRPPVEWVQSSWAGIEALIDIGNKDYRLTVLKDVFGPQMAEYVMAYVLAHEIRPAWRLANQQRRQWNDTPSGTVRGKTFGVMGTGSIGCHLAKVATHFSMTPIGFNTSGRPTEPFQHVYGNESLTEFLGNCDYLVAVLPATSATTKLLDTRAFEAMKDTALLINAGRGNLIDESALVRALSQKQLAGAVLDVFQEEPLPPDSPLWKVPDLVITGHVAAVSNTTDIVRVFLENYRLFSNGLPLHYQVDFARGY